MLIDTAGTAVGQVNGLAAGHAARAGCQSIDLAATGQQLNIAELEDMHIHKTGALIRDSVVLGALSNTRTDEAALAKLDHYAKCIGLAFQIRDDILDIEGTTEEIGKQQGADIAHDKATYPSLLGMDEARRRSDELLKMALAELDSLDYDTEGLDYLAHMIVLRRT